MVEEKFVITINGCWKDDNLNKNMPEYSGIFFVFEAKPTADGLVPLRLIYVGEAENVRKGVLNFVRKFEEMKYLRHGNTLCYHAAEVQGNARERVQAAFVYTHKPPANDRYKYLFPFAPTHIKSKGKTGFLKSDFKV